MCCECFFLCIMPPASFEYCLHHRLLTAFTFVTLKATNSAAPCRGYSSSKCESPIAMKLRRQPATCQLKSPTASSLLHDPTTCPCHNIDNGRKRRHTTHTRTHVHTRAYTATFQQEAVLSYINACEVASLHGHAHMHEIHISARKVIHQEFCGNHTGQTLPQCTQRSAAKHPQN